MACPQQLPPHNISPLSEQLPHHYPSAFSKQLPPSLHQSPQQAAAPLITPRSSAASCAPHYTKTLSKQLRPSPHLNSPLASACSTIPDVWPASDGCAPPLTCGPPLAAAPTTPARARTAAAMPSKRRGRLVEDTGDMSASARATWRARACSRTRATSPRYLRSPSAPPAAKARNDSLQFYFDSCDFLLLASGHGSLWSP